MKRVLHDRESGGYYNADGTLTQSLESAHHFQNLSEAKAFIDRFQLTEAEVHVHVSPGSAAIVVPLPRT